MVGRREFGGFRGLYGDWSRESSGGTMVRGWGLSSDIMSERGGDDEFRLLEGDIFKQGMHERIFIR